MELYDSGSINTQDQHELPVLPLEIWRLIVSFCDGLEKLKFGIAVLGYEYNIGCPSSILIVIKIQVTKLQIFELQIYNLKLEH